jgi:hypothetical protein
LRNDKNNQQGLDKARHKLASKKVTIDVECLVSRIKKWNQTEAYAEHLLAGSSILKIQYEQIVENVHSVLRKIQNFINVTPRRLPVFFAKGNTKSLEERVTNIDEVRQVLKQESLDDGIDD